ncbi:MAG: D-alanyl-D-alanine carboxypeptidase [Lachnospiraceae bacterium]|nr:D-alanyl-D-alanine carboxypeptidase [Lachnospiraceae bacterium]
MKRNFFKKALFTITFVSILLSPATSYASEVSYMEQNLQMPVKSNSVDNWPVGPAVNCYSAVLMDADTGVILYEKNAHETMYPASTTKLMTSLLAMEKDGANLNDMVEFSYDAVMSIPRDASNMGIDPGEKMTLEECLYGILVVSANEVANAVAEYVSGDIDSFVKLMNERAKELGCTDTHFNNAHGYTDPNHYTSAYDLALMARAFFKNELLSKICRTPTYHWYATEYQPDDFILGSTNYFFRGTKSCDGLVGSKTGYTDESRNTLVSCAERNGMKLICVVMKEETPYQYDDTNLLFDYGFSNFEKVRVYDYETKFIVTDESFFHSDSDVFGDSRPIFTMDNSSMVILPKTLTFSDLNSTLSIDNESDSDKVATVTYDYKGVYLGKADIFFSKSAETEFAFDKSDASDLEEQKKPTYIYINNIIYVVLGVFGAIMLFTLIKRLFRNVHFAERRKASRRWHKRKRHVPGPSYKAYKKEVRSGRPRKKKKRSSSYIDI